MAGDLLLVPPSAQCGRDVSTIDTPSLVVDLDAFEENLAQMQSLADRGGVALRPHGKAHKSVAVAKKQLAGGAVGICCQKLSEAFAFANGGITNIHISNEFMGEAKVKMAVELARHVSLSVCVDALPQIHALSDAAKAADIALWVLPEVDVGHGRCGVATSEELLQLVDGISESSHLQFGGVQGYHGPVQHIAVWQDRRHAALRAAETLHGHLRHLEARGIKVPVVTGGGTGTAEFDIAGGVYTEVQPGTYAMLDGHYGSNEWRGEFRPRHSLFVAATVMSAARPGIAVCDVGLKTVAVDSGLPRVWPSHPSNSLRYVSASDEHGVLEVLQGHEREYLGRPLLLIPGHCDPTANLHREYVCIRDNRVVGSWAIDAGGMSR